MNLNIGLSKITEAGEPKNENEESLRDIWTRRTIYKLWESQKVKNREPV